NDGASKAGSFKTVPDRRDTFLARQPGVSRDQVPGEMVPASGSGLDRDLAQAPAYIQVKRVAAARGLAENRIKALVDRHTEKPLLGCLGPARVNVLKLNVALDELKP